MNPSRSAMLPETVRPGLERLIGDHAVRQLVADAITSGPDPTDGWARFLAMLEADPDLVQTRPALDRALAIAGASPTLALLVSRHPGLLVGRHDSSDTTLAARAALVPVAADDLRGALDMADATRLYAEGMDQVVEECLGDCRSRLLERHPLLSELPFAVVAMGKWGAKELNYASDIDLVLVHDTHPSGSDNEARAAALALASALLTTLNGGGGNGPALVVDADLRPEGTRGPLSRSLDGYRRYYRQWGEAWELQALLKARPAAGDRELGNRFMELAEQLIWEEGLDVESLRSIRKLKERAEEEADPDDIKRARGGIRDVEFSVQLLQLVHGRLDPELRVASTLRALPALADAGFVTGEEHDLLASAYRFLRDVEHRIQLWDLRQGHRVPEDPIRRAQIGRSLGMTGEPGVELERRLAEVRSVVRDLHERLYFRPILEALVGSPSARLGVEQASLRMEALGFRDVKAAAQAVEDLTSGLSRRSRAMHQMLPLMLDWLSLSPDPDLGLAQLRIVLARTPDHAALVTLLQTNPLAGERLCRLLGSSRLIGDLIDRIPEFIPRIADEARLTEIREKQEELTRLLGLLDARPGTEAKTGTIRRFARRRKLRIAARDILGLAPTESTLTALTDGADVTVTAALHVVSEGDPTGFCAVAMGKWGGGELSYGSDLDVMYVVDEEARREQGVRLSQDLSRVLSEPSRHGEAYSLDPGLRPEGRSGPMARSLDSYRRYYRDWAEPWELLALIKARPVCGDQMLSARFAELVTEAIWARPVSGEFVRSVREIKARVEKERIPPGEDADFHLKLGKGSLSDIEFLVQLLQVRHGRDRPRLQVSGTLEGLHGLTEEGILEAEEAAVLEESYLFCTSVRLRLHLQAGRAVDSLPTDPVELRSLASSLGYDRSSELRDEYRRVTRRARRVFQRRFYD